MLRYPSINSVSLYSLFHLYW